SQCSFNSRSLGGELRPFAKSLASRRLLVANLSERNDLLALCIYVPIGVDSLHAVRRAICGNARCGSSSAYSNGPPRRSARYAGIAQGRCWTTDRCVRRRNDCRLTVYGDFATPEESDCEHDSGEEEP